MLGLIILFFTFVLMLFGQSGPVEESSDGSKYYNNNSVYEEAEVESNLLAEPTFRNTYWGNSKTDVKFSETATLEDSDYESLVFVENNLAIVYFFNEYEELYQASYISFEYFTDDSEYLAEYHKIGEALKIEYGQPVSTDIETGNFDFIEGENNTSYLTTWETEESEITLSVTFGDEEPMIVLVYEDIDFE